jgi:hypothetical protein
LSTGKGKAVVLELVLDFIPQPGALEGMFHPFGEAAFEAVQTQRTATGSMEES